MGTTSVHLLTGGAGKSQVRMGCQVLGEKKVGAAPGGAGASHPTVEMGIMATGGVQSLGAQFTTGGVTAMVVRGGQTHTGLVRMQQAKVRQALGKEVMFRLMLGWQQMEGELPCPNQKEMLKIVGKIPFEIVFHVRSSKVLQLAQAIEAADNMIASDHHLSQLMRSSGLS
jgi:hypothetical protein